MHIHINGKLVGEVMPRFMVPVGSRRLPGEYIAYAILPGGTSFIVGYHDTEAEAVERVKCYARKRGHAPETRSYPTRAHHYMAEAAASPAWLAITAVSATEVGHETMRYEARDGSAVIATPRWQALGVHRDRVAEVAARLGTGALTHALNVFRTGNVGDALPKP